MYRDNDKLLQVVIWCHMLCIKEIAARHIDINSKEKMMMIQKVMFTRSYS